MKHGALALVAMGAVPGFVVRSALAQSRAARSKVLVVVFQRGAVDGLSMLVPHGDPRLLRGPRRHRDRAARAA
jgi:uncharacterized protein (DUF1501 family)